MYHLLHKIMNQKQKSLISSIGIIILLFLILSLLIYFYLTFYLEKLTEITSSELNPQIKEVKEGIKTQNIYLPDQDIYLLSLEKDNKTGTFTLKNIEFSKGYIQEQPIFPEDNYILKVFNKQGDIIYTSSFNISEAIITEVFEEGDISGNIDFPEKTEFYITIPYSKESEKIQIYSKDNLQKPFFETTLWPPQSLKTNTKNLSSFAVSSAKAAANAQCKTLLNNGPPTNNYDITFIGDKDYNTAGESEFVWDILRETLRFFKLNPLDQYWTGFNVHYVSSFEADCIGSSINKIMNCFNYSHLISVCPTDLVVVMKNNNVQGLAWFNTGPIYTGDYPYIFAHEAGHSIGGLWDEYVYNNCNNRECTSKDFLWRDISTSPNCDVSNCTKWEGISGTSCYAGCTASDWYKSVEYSLMRNLSVADFGPVGKNHFLKVLTARFGPKLPKINIPPQIISIRGPSIGEVNKNLEFYFKAFDYNDKSLKLTIDWGDGSIVTSGAKINGEGQELLQKKKYKKTGTFFITAKVIDPHNAESEWLNSFQIRIIKKAEKPTLTFNANPTTIKKGESSILSWSSTNAISCKASKGWSGTKPPSGSEMVSPSKKTTYRLTCSGLGGLGGKISKSLIIRVK